MTGLPGDHFCPNCGHRLRNAPHHHGLGDRGELVVVMECPSCEIFFAQGSAGNPLETEAYDNED